ncbi:monocarboxylate transporter 5-like [Lytechinus variegatus]|uniref:monocarboxylate transporter 5-like n=1 Tax=Lytechinus variegatus TaxID=7654 RepID=UPI001BB2B1F9|nr:monocarboxylate transporter 5-like [Lytechinus variegatus]
MGTERSSKRTSSSWGYAIVLSKFVVLTIDTGIAKSFGVLIPTMVKRLESDYATVGFICSMPSTLMYVLCPIIIIFLKKMDRRVIAMIGGLICGSCMIACSFFTNIVVVGILLALSGAGLSMSYMPTVLALNEFFPENFVFANSISLYGYTAGSILLPIITERSLVAYGYSGAYVILGSLALNLVACGATLRKAPRDNTTNEGENIAGMTERQNGTDGMISPNQCSVFLDGGEDDEPTEDEGDKTGLIKTKMLNDRDQGKLPKTGSTWTRSFVESCKQSFGILNESIYLISLPLHFSIYYLTFAWMLFLVPHAEQLGIAPSKAIFLSTIGGIGGIIGRTLMLIIIHKKFQVYTVYTATGVVCTTSFLLDFIGSSYGVRAVLAFVQGYSFFIEDCIPGNLYKDAICNDANFGASIALSSFLGGLGATAAGTFSGYLYDVTHSFTKVFIINGCIHACVVCNLAFVAILIKRRNDRATSS